MELHATSVLLRLIRLRQLCLHPTLTGAKFDADSTIADSSELGDETLAEAALGPLAGLLDKNDQCETTISMKRPVRECRVEPLIARSCKASSAGVPSRYAKRSKIAKTDDQPSSNRDRVAPSSKLRHMGKWRLCYRH